MKNDNFEVFFNIAIEYKSNKEYEKAEKAYLKALEYESESNEALFNLASIYLLLNEPYKAIEYLKK